MPKTLKGIYHNLKESEYTTSNGEVVFFFSSKLYMNKFLKEYKFSRNTFDKKFNNMTTNNSLNIETLSDITLYIKTEKRGFRVWLNGMEISKEDLHLYALRKMTSKNTDDWREIQKPKLAERLKIMG